MTNTNLKNIPKFLVVHRTTPVIIFGSLTKFQVVLGLPDYHYFDPWVTYPDDYDGLWVESLQSLHRFTASAVIHMDITAVSLRSKQTYTQRLIKHHNSTVKFWQHCSKFTLNLIVFHILLYPRYIHTRKLVCTHAHIYKQMDLWIHTHTRMYTYTNARIYKCTHACIHTHTVQYNQFYNYFIIVKTMLRLSSLYKERIRKY